MDHVLSRSAVHRLRSEKEAKWEKPVEPTSGPAASFAQLEDDPLVEVMNSTAGEEPERDARGEYYIGFNSPKGEYDPAMPGLAEFYSAPNSDFRQGATASQDAEKVQPTGRRTLELRPSRPPNQ